MNQSNPVQEPLPNIAFIVGMGRSGTTMLTNILNSNDAIISSPENEFILHSYSTYQSKNFDNVEVRNSFEKIFDKEFSSVISIWKPLNAFVEDIKSLAIKNFRNVCKLVYLNYPLSGKEKKVVKYIIDKNPSYSLHLNVLQKLFPGAGYIVIIRDYRDNILSRKNFSDNNTSIYKLAATWMYYYDRIFKDIKKYALPFHVIRYEDLVSDPETHIKSICKFLSLNYSENMLNFQSLSKELKKYAGENVSEDKTRKIMNMHQNLDKKINADRVNAFKTEMNKDNIKFLDNVCEKYAEQFGYKKLDENKINFIEKFKYKIAYVRTHFYFVFIRIYYKIPFRYRPTL